MQEFSDIIEFQKQTLDLICADWLDDATQQYIPLFENSLYYLLKYYLIVSILLYRFIDYRTQNKYYCQKLCQERRF